MNFKESKSQLIDTYKYKIETHAHTNPTSPCGKASPQEAVRIYKELGYDAVCITNHFFLALFDNQEIYQNLSKEEKINRYLKDFYDAKAEGDRLGINVILGAELRFIGSDNDFLIYGIDKDALFEIYDYLDNTVEYFRENVHLENSLFIQAHPCRSNCFPIDASLLDGVETFNSHIYHNASFPRAIRYAYDNNINITIPGSDFHMPGVGNAGAAALRTKILPKDTYELVDILKDTDYIFELGEHSILLP